MSTGFWAPPYRTDFYAPRGGGSSGTSSSTSKVVLPDWVDTASQSNYNQAVDVANRDYQANPYSQYANVSPMQQQAWNQIQGLQGQADPAYSQAQAVSSGLLGQAAPITTGQISGNASALMNPYQLATVAPTIASMREALAQEQNKTAGEAANVGAYGGSRLGIEQGTAAGQEAVGEGKLVGGLLQQGYDTASQQAMDIAKTNQALGSQQISLLPQLASSQANLDAQQSQLLDTAGQQQQQQWQSALDTAAQNWQDQWNYPLEQVAIKQGALSSSPYGYTTYSTGTQTGGSNLAGNVMGGISTAVGLLGLIK